MALAVAALVVLPAIAVELAGAASTAQALGPSNLMPSLCRHP
jgi:hypothetical protein